MMIASWVRPCRRLRKAVLNRRASVYEYERRSIGGSGQTVESENVERQVVGWANTTPLRTLGVTMSEEQHRKWVKR